MEEIWKDVVGYEGYYQVSNLGRIKSLDRLGKDGRKLQSKILKQSNRNGYWRVGLTNQQGTTKSYSVHYLVAIAFIPNPNNLPQVSHKDENNLNNSNICNNNVNNLEWSSAYDNSNTPKHKQRISNSRKGSIFSEEHKKNIGLAQIGRKHKPFSEEAKEKIRQKLLGKPLSEEHKRKISEAHKGKIPTNTKSVICEDKIYYSLSEFCRINHINIHTLSSWLNHKTEMPQEWKDRGLKYAE